MTNYQPPTGDEAANQGPATEPQLTEDVTSAATEHSDAPRQGMEKALYVMLNFSRVLWISTVVTILLFPVLGLLLFLEAPLGVVGTIVQTVLYSRARKEFGANPTPRQAKLLARGKAGTTVAWVIFGITIIPILFAAIMMLSSLFSHY